MNYSNYRKAYRNIEVFQPLFKDLNIKVNTFQLKAISLFFEITSFLKIYKLTTLFLLRILKKRRFKSTEKRIGFVYTLNQFKILKKIREFGVHFPVYFFNINQSEFSNDQYISNRIIFLSLISNKNVSHLLKEGMKDPIINNDIVRYLRLIGLKEIYDFLLNNKVKEILNFNDHSPYNVLLIDLAKEREIKTIYFQHAPVSEKFPELFHDLNVLFSRDSLNKYKIPKGNNNIDIELLCDLRFLNIKNYKLPLNETILVCPNELDNVEIVESFIKELSNKSYQVILRPHPLDRRAWRNSNRYIRSGNKNVLDDLKNVKYLITNESAVVLEAMFLKRLVYKAAFFSSSIDHYGFIKEKLILKEYHQTNELITSIENNKIDYDINKLNYFLGDLENSGLKINEILKQ